MNKIVPEIWSGFWRAFGQLAAIAVLGWLGTRISPIRDKVAGLFGGRASSGKIDLTIYLFVSILVLLGLLAWCWISYWRLLRRVRDGELTFGDFYGTKEMMKATDIEQIIRDRRDGTPKPKNKYLEVYNEQWKESVEREIEKRKKNRDT